MTTIEMIRSAPQELTVDPKLIAEAMDAASACVVTCTTCASACLSETGMDMTQCIRDDLDCADLCDVTVKHLARLNAGDRQLTQAILTACIEACRQCAASCEEHADHHEHCKLCAQACRRCETACQALLDAVQAA